MTKKTSAIGANIGILTGVFFNIFLWLNVPSIFWFWWNAIGFLITFLVGLIVSNLLRNNVSQTYEIVYFAKFKDILKLILYFVIILSISLLLPNIF